MVLPKTTSKKGDNVVEANIVRKCCGLQGPDATTICKHCVVIQEDEVADFFFYELWMQP